MFPVSMSQLERLSHQTVAASSACRLLHQVARIQARNCVQMVYESSVSVCLTTNNFIQNVLYMKPGNGAFQQYSLYVSACA